MAALWTLMSHQRDIGQEVPVIKVPAQDRGLHPCEDLLGGPVPLDQRMAISVGSDLLPGLVATCEATLETHLCGGGDSRVLWQRGRGLFFHTSRAWGWSFPGAKRVTVLV